MALAVLRAQEGLHLIRERNQPEQVALLLGGLPENQRGGDEAFEDAGFKLRVLSFESGSSDGGGRTCNLQPGT